MLLDPEVNRISTDAVRTVAKAAELMVEHLATRSYAVASSNKRSTIKFADVDRAAHGDQRYVDMGLKDSFATEGVFASARGEDKATGGNAKVAKGAGPVQKGRPITEFFNVRNRKQVAGHWFHLSGCLLPPHCRNLMSRTLVEACAVCTSCDRCRALQK